MSVIFQIVTLAMVFFMLLAGHYLPWHVIHPLVDKRGELKRTVAYAYGTLCIFIGFAMFALATGQPDALAWQAAVIVAAAAGTMLPRLIGRQIEKRAEFEELKERNGSAKPR